MDETTYWQLLGEAREAVSESTDPEQDFLDAVAGALEDMPPEEIAAFQRLTSGFNRQAYTYGIAGAFYVMTDGEADELDLEGFRGWLIAQGESVFKKAIADPDSLADEDVVPSATYLPDILTLAAGIYREQTAEEVPDDPNAVLPEDPSGDELTVEDLTTKLPKLCDQFFFGDDEPLPEAESAEAP